ncbi:hypothetical protein SAMN02799624_05825 [Paenibacillus sp. UNC496MF]|nr:hypothetical protein SAMN02799624_05825 [Paenibacillus sp. UNC496MF]
MEIEEELVSMLSLLFFVIIIPYFFIVLYYVIKTKHLLLNFLFLQIFFLVIAYFTAIHWLNDSTNTNSIMESEENSLYIGLVVLFWAVSMVCLIIGLLGLIKRNKKDV